MYSDNNSNLATAERPAVEKQKPQYPSMQEIRSVTNDLYTRTAEALNEAMNLIAPEDHPNTFEEYTAAAKRLKELRDVICNSVDDDGNFKLGYTEEFNHVYHGKDVESTKPHACDMGSSDLINAIMKNDRVRIDPDVRINLGVLHYAMALIPGNNYQSGEDIDHYIKRVERLAVRRFADEFPELEPLDTQVESLRTQVKSIQNTIQSTIDYLQGNHLDFTSALEGIKAQINEETLGISHIEDKIAQAIESNGGARSFLQRRIEEKMSEAHQNR